MTGTTEKVSRRELRFASLDEAIQDAERLQREGYVPVGKWDLAQCLDHISDWMLAPLDGFPRPPLPMRLMMTMMRWTIGPRIFRKILADGKMAEGVPTAPQTVHVATSDPNRTEAALTRFRDAVRRFQEAKTVLPSPFFGSMTLEQGRALQLIHCAHHLSFLVPGTRETRST